MRTDTEATVELWQEQAMHNLQAAEDFKLELADARREMCELEKQITAERALADLLAGAIEAIWPFLEEDIPHGCNSTAYMISIELCRGNLTAWKEARSECR